MKRPRASALIALAAVLAAVNVSLADDPPLIQRLNDDAKAAKDAFVAANLAPIHYDSLEKEYKTVQTPAGDLTSAWGSYHDAAAAYRTFCGQLISAKPQELVDKIRAAGRSFSLQPDEVEPLIPKYQQLQATLKENGITWKDNQFIKPDGRPFKPDELVRFVQKKNPQLNSQAEADLQSRNQELFEIQKIAKTDPAAATQRLSQVLDGLSQRKDLLENGFGSLPLQTTLALVQQTRDSLPKNYQSQVKQGLSNVDSQLQAIAEKKIVVPDFRPGHKPPPSSQLSVDMQLSYYGALSAFPATAKWANQKFFEVNSRDTLSKNPNVSDYQYSDKDPFGNPRHGFTITMKDGSTRYESDDGFSVVTSADKSSTIVQDKKAGTYVQTKDGKEVFSWTKDQKTGKITGRFRGTPFAADKDELLIVSPDESKLFIAKGLDKDKKPIIDRWVGDHHERGWMLPNGMGQVRQLIEDEADGKQEFHKDVLLQPALLKDMMSGKGLDLSAVDGKFLDPAVREKFTVFLKDLPELFGLFEAAFKGQNDSSQQGGKTVSHSVTVDAFYFRDNQLNLVIGERSGASDGSQMSMSQKRVVGIVENNSLKVFYMTGSTTFMWKFNPAQDAVDEYRPATDGSSNGRMSFELARREEKKGGHWVVTQNNPIKMKEWSTWDDVKAIGGGALEKIGEGVGIVFSPFQTVVYDAVGLIHIGLSHAMSDQELAGLTKVSGFYSLSQAKFNSWLSGGSDGEQNIMRNYNAAMTNVLQGNPDGQRIVKLYLDSEIEKQRRQTYGETYFMHEHDPITDRDRAYTAARVFGLGNLAGQYAEQGKENWQQGNTWTSVAQYGAAAFVVGGEAYCEGFGFGLAAAPLKAMAVGGRVGLTGEEVVNAMGKASKGAQLAGKEAQAVKLLNAVNKAELYTMLAPGVTSLGSEGFQAFDSWRKGDTEGAWTHFNGAYLNAAGFSAMGLGLVQARISEYAAARSRVPVETSRANGSVDLVEGEETPVIKPTNAELVGGKPGVKPANGVNALVAEPKVVTSNGDTATATAVKPGEGGTATAVLTKPADLARAQLVLGREVTPKEADAIEHAHHIGDGEPGEDGTPAKLDNYTFAQKRAKYESLRKAGFTPEQVRGLMENGVVGAGELPFGQRYFTQEELAKAHPQPDGVDVYHDVTHSLRVSDMAVDFAKGRGLNEAQVKFVGEVALLHDFDPGRKPGTPARVPATLEALEKDFRGEVSLTGEPGKSVLKTRFGWTADHLKMAEAMIQRTEFPFDATHKSPAYKDVPPPERYRQMVEGLPEKQRAFVLREAPLLSEYADKSSHYSIEDFNGAVGVVHGLVGEINTSAGAKVVDAKALNTPDFLSKVGAPGWDAFDVQLAKQLGVNNLKLPSRAEAFAKMPPEYGKTFEGNLKGFEAYQKALTEGMSPEKALEQGERAVAREKVLESYRDKFRQWLKENNQTESQLSPGERQSLLQMYLKHNGLAENGIGQALLAETRTPITTTVAPTTTAKPTAPAGGRASVVAELSAQYQIDPAALDAEVTKSLAERKVDASLLRTIESLPEPQRTEQWRKMLLNPEFFQQLKPLLSQARFNQGRLKDAKGTFENDGSYHKLNKRNGGELVRDQTQLFRHVNRTELQRVIDDKGFVPKALKESGSEIGSALRRWGGALGLVKARVIDNPEAKSWLYEYTEHRDVNRMTAIATAGPIKLEIIPRADQIFYDTSNMSTENVGHAERGWATLDPVAISQIKIFDDAGCKAGCWLTSPEGQALAKSLLSGK